MSVQFWPLVGRQEEGELRDGPLVSALGCLDHSNTDQTVFSAVDAFHLSEWPRWRDIVLPEYNHVTDLKVTSWAVPFRELVQRGQVFGAPSLPKMTN